MRQKSFVRYLDLDNRVRISFRVDKGRIKRFVVQYESFVDAKWRPIIRYDTAHGFAHADLFRPRGKPGKIPMPTKDFGEALTFYKNLLLGTEFDKYLIEHPRFAESVPDGALVVLLPHDDPALCKENLRIAKARVENGQPVVYIKIKKLAPVPRSRIVGPEIKYAKTG